MTRASQIRFWLIGALVFFALLYLLRGVLLPFVAGMAIAYFLDPLADRLERAGVSRMWATTIITLAVFLLFILMIVLLVPVLQDQIVSFAKRVPDYMQALGDRLEPLVRNAQQYLSPADVERLRTAVGDYAGTLFGWIGEVVKGVLTGGIAVVNILSLLFITPVVTFYLLRDWDHMLKTVDSWLPRRQADTIRAQAREIDRTLAAFVRGQATVCLALGTFYALALSAVGLDIGLIVGLGSGLLSFIPYVGSITGFVVSVGLALAQSPDWTLPIIVGGIFIFGQAIEGNFLTPKLVGDRVGLHPVWVIFALLAGGALFGFLGVLLAVPVASVIGVLARFSLGNYLNSPLYHGKRPGVGDGS